MLEYSSVRQGAVRVHLAGEETNPPGPVWAPSGGIFSMRSLGLSVLVGLAALGLAARSEAGGGNGGCRPFGWSGGQQCGCGGGFGGGRGGYASCGPVGGCGISYGRGLPGGYNLAYSPSFYGGYGGYGAGFGPGFYNPGFAGGFSP